MIPNTPRSLGHVLRACAGAALLFSLVSSADGAWAAPGDVTRVSVDSAGLQGNAASGRSVISADGRYVAFMSGASNLVPGDTNGVEDVFVHDRQTGATERVSVADDESQADQGSDRAAISSDGRFVAFTSGATNLVTGDANGIVDVFVRDRVSGTTTRVSVATGGVEVTGDPFADYNSLSISGDGRYVGFDSDLVTLVTGDTNGATDVFVHDRQTGITKRASVDSSGSEGNSGSTIPAISSDGRFVAFSSGASNLVAGDTNGVRDVFVHEISTGVTTRASVNSAGEQADKGCTEPAISADGRFVAFSSEAENLASGYEMWESIYVHDRQTGQTTRASVFDGYTMVGWSEVPVISGDGRYVAFEYDDKGDGEPYRWIYVHDRLTGSTTSVAGPGRTDDNSSPSSPSISGDGRFIAFDSGHAGVVPGDTNGAQDVFVREVSYPADVSPVVQGADPSCGSGGCDPTAQASIVYHVDFSEVVTGVTADDFSLVVGGGITGASITSVAVSSGSASSYRVTVNTGSGDGTLRLDVLDDDSIRDMTSNPLGGSGAGNGGFTGGLAVVDKNVPAVAGITRLDPDPTSASSVRFSVVFSEDVRNVDNGDFAVATTIGVTGAAVTGVEGSGGAYTVTVNTGAGDGTLRLDVVDDDSILDAASKPLGGDGAGNGAFTRGESYTLNRGGPTVVSSVRTDPDPTSAESVRFTVTFSESVTGVDVADFTLAATGVSGPGIASVSGSGAAYTVTVNTGSGNGSIRLDVTDNDSILDASSIPLGGPGPGNGAFVAGQTYTVDKQTIRILSETVRSNGLNDGWVRESAEDSNLGGDKNNRASTFVLGDDAQDRQYRAILHFPTSYLPDNAVVTQAILLIKLQGGAGTNPYGTHGNIAVDIRSGLFGSGGFFGFNSLDPGDFEWPAHMDSAGVVLNNPVGGWYWTLLDPASYPYINVQGTTQLRLRFQTDDNEDNADDYLAFFSGDHGQIMERPQLLIKYFVQR